MTSESLGDLSGCRLKDKQKGKMKYILYSKDSAGNLHPQPYQHCLGSEFHHHLPELLQKPPALASCLQTLLPAIFWNVFSTLLTRVTLIPRAWMLSHFSHVQLFVTPWTVARQGPLSMGFPRQECWIGLPYSLLGDIPDPRIKPGSPTLLAKSLPSEPLEKSNFSTVQLQ